MKNNDVIDVIKNAFEEEAKEFIPGTTPIPSSGKVITADDVSAIASAALDGWFTEGRWAEEFKKDLISYLNRGVRYVSLANSGSSANLLAITAITQKEFGHRAAKPGDEIITTACGFPTTVSGILQNGLVPVFVDVDLRTYVPRPDDVMEAITEKTKAIFLAHTLGNPFNLEAMRCIADEYDLFLIGDNCDALGATHDGVMTGTVEDLATLSFYPAHHITMGEGGAVTTNSSMLYKVLESLRSWCRDCWCPPGHDNTCGSRFSKKFGDLPFGYDHKYVYSRLGYNFKITDMQAALGVSQLKMLQRFVEKRRHNWQFLRTKLDKYKKSLMLPEPTPKSDPSWFGFCVTRKVFAPFETDELIQFLESRKIATRRLFAGNVLKHPAFVDIPHRISGKLYNTDYIVENTFWIGVWPGITDEMLEYIVKSFDEFMEAHK